LRSTKYGLCQKFPRTVNSFYRLVESPIQIPDREPLTMATSDVTVVGWAEAATYSHRVVVTFDIVPYDFAELPS